MAEVSMVGRFEAHTLPDGDTVYFDAKPHRYYAEIQPSRSAEGGYSYVQGSQLPGVSTIAPELSGNPDPLCDWAAEQERIAICKLASEQGIDPAGMSPEQLHAELSAAGLTWRMIRDAAGREGSAVHRWVIQTYAESGEAPDLSMLPESARRYGQGAMRWLWDRQPKPVLAEALTADLRARYAGQFDLLCETENGRELVDAKRRKSGKDRRADHVQVEGYERANIACEIGPSDRRTVLLLLPDGSYREIPSKAGPGHWAAALNAHVLGKSLDKAMGEERKERV